MAAALFTATASAQLVVEDFNSKTPGEKVALFNVNKAIYGDRVPKGEAKIIEDPTSSGKGNVVEVKCDDYETIVEVDVTLPDGKLSDYSEISFELYYDKAASREGDDSQCYKRVYVKADNQDIYVADNTNILAEKEIKKGEWGTFSTAIPDNNVGSSFALRLGILGGPDEPGTYYIDNICLKEKEEPGTSHNGEMVGDWYMLQDFETATKDDIAAWDKGEYGIPEETTVEIIKNPTADNEKVAWFAGGNLYNTILEVKAKIPSDKTLADYSEIAFDLYRNEEEVNDYPGLYIRVNDIIIHDDGNGGSKGEYGPEMTWTPVTKPLTGIVGLEGITGQIQIRLGLLSEKPSYLIDNVRLKPTTATGITDVQAGAETVVVVDGGVMINAGAKAAYAVYDISGRAVSQGVADGSKTVTLQRGVYVVRVNGKAVKVLVR